MSSNNVYHLSEHRALITSTSAECHLPTTYHTVNHHYLQYLSKYHFKLSFQHNRPCRMSSWYHVYVQSQPTTNHLNQRIFMRIHQPITLLLIITWINSKTCKTEEGHYIIIWSYIQNGTRSYYNRSFLAISIIHEFYCFDITFSHKETEDRLLFALLDQ